MSDYAQIVHKYTDALLSKDVYAVFGRVLNTQQRSRMPVSSSAWAAFVTGLVWLRVVFEVRESQVVGSGA